MGTQLSTTSGIYRLKNVYNLPVPLAVHLLRLWFRIPPTAWMFICCDYCVLRRRGLCYELITLPEDPYREWCVVVCDLESSRIRTPSLALGLSATGGGGGKCELFSFERGFVGYVFWVWYTLDIIRSIIFLYYTYSNVLAGKPLSEAFHIHNDLKELGALSLLWLNFALGHFRI